MIMKENNNQNIEQLKFAHHNDFFVNAHGTLTNDQLRMLLYVIAKIPSSTDRAIPAVAISLDEICELLHWNANATSVVFNVKSFLENLAKSTLTFTNNATREYLIIPWFEYIRNHEEEHVFYMKLNNHLETYLMNLKRNFTVYKLGYSLMLGCPTSILLYDFFKTNAFKRTFEINISDLKAYLSLYIFDEHGNIIHEKYPEFKKFSARILRPAIEEINRLTDIDVEYEMIKGIGNKASKISFTVKDKVPETPSIKIPAIFEL